MYPDTSITESGSGTYSLQLTQSLDQSTSLVSNIIRINTNTANNKSSVYVLQAYTSSGLPSYDGQYTAKLMYETPTTRTTWGETHYLFGSHHVTWGNPYAGEAQEVAEDRAYVHGTNTSTITKYITTNEDGTYTTYNN